MGRVKRGWLKLQYKDWGMDIGANQDDDETCGLILSCHLLIPFTLKNINALLFKT